MDRKQNLDDLQTAILAALDGRQAIMWTALPATVISFNPEVRTVSAQVTVRCMATDRNGVQHWVMLPPLLDCPVFFPGGRGLSLTFPLQAGDEVLIIFASRCIDNWFKRGGVQNQAELRMHDLSDGFCFPALLSEPEALSRAPVSLDAAELRNAAGTTKIRLMNNGDIQALTPGGASVVAGSLMADISGAAVVNAASAAINAATIALNGIVSINGQLYSEHRHTQVAEGDDVSGGVA